MLTPSAFSENHSKSNVIITKIKSDFIDIRRKSETIDFLNNVVVEREDTSFLADKMTAYYYENTGESANNTQSGDDSSGHSKSIKEIDAWGNVKIFNQEFTAIGDSGIYDPSSGTFTLIDNVVFNNGTSVAKGQKFVYNLNTKKGYLFGIKDEQGASTAQDQRVVVVIGDDIGKDDSFGAKKNNKNRLKQ